MLEFQTYLNEVFEVLAALSRIKFDFKFSNRPRQLLSTLINADVDQPQRETAQNGFRELREAMKTQQENTR